jgi:formate dehydrogenase major subunit
MPTRSVVTTCAYCGVGCSFRAEVQGEGRHPVVRMMPCQDGGANEGHSCVKGRFAYGYAAHPDRQLHPMVRDTIDDEWRRVSWEEAIAGRRGLPDIQAATASAPSAASRRRGAPTKRSTSSRRWSAPPSATTTSTPAPGCATPPPVMASTRPSAPRPAPRTSSRSTTPTSCCSIGANPTDAHPVFGSRLKRGCVRAPSSSSPTPAGSTSCSAPHVEAAHHLPVRPGTNVAFVNALAYVIVTEGLHDHRFLQERCENVEFA